VHEKNWAGNLTYGATVVHEPRTVDELLDVRRGDEDFAGMVVGLGSLGILTSVTLDIVPTFEVRQDLFEHLPWTDVTEHFDAVTSSAYSVSMFTDWSPAGPHQIWTKSRTDAGPVTELFGATLATRELHPLPGVDAGATTRQLGVPGPWWDRLPHFRLAVTPSDGDELQTEYLVRRDSTRSTPCAPSTPSSSPSCWWRRSARSPATTCG
jgi:xylitol oxidase